MPSAKDIKAGAAYVELAVRDNRFRRGLDAAARRLKAFGAGVATVGAGVIAQGTAMAAPFVALAFHFKDAGDALNKMSARTGASVEALSELGFAAEQSGGNIEDVESALRTMAKNLVSTYKEAAPAADALAKLGISMDELSKLAPEDQFARIAEGISQVQHPTARAAYAMDIFGKAGQKLLPLLAGGEKDIAKLRKEAEKLGITVGTDQAQAAADLGDAWNRLVRVAGKIPFEIGSALAEDLIEIMTLIKPFLVEFLKLVKENKGWVVTIVATGAALIALGGIVVATGLSISVMGFALSGLVTGFTALVAVLGVVKAAFLAIFTPVGLIIGVTAVLAAGIIYLTYEAFKASEDAMNGLRHVMGILGDYFKGLWSTFKETWGGIVAALKKGDLRLAGKIALSGLEVAWLRTVTVMTRWWNGFKNVIVDGFREAMAGVEILMIDTVKALADLLPDSIKGRVGLDVFTDRNVEAAKAGIVRDTDAETARRRAARADDLTQAQNELAAAQAELAALVAEAKRVEVAEAAPARKLAKKAAEEVAPVAELARITRGAFSAPNYSQVFALGESSIDRKQLEALNQIEAKAEGVRQAVVKLGDELKFF